MKVLLPFVIPLLLLVLFTLPLTLKAATQNAPHLMLANTWRVDMPLDQYWVSEKLDGVRAYWDGSQLRSRGGYPIQAPEWFTADFPEQPLDGELWLGRGRFNEISAIIRSDNIADPRWDEVHYMVFDLPTQQHKGVPATFEQRRLALQLLLGQRHIRWLEAVQYYRLADEKALQHELAQVVGKGGEGLMLNRAQGLYRAARSDDILKLKPSYDAEALVLGHLDGRGKYTGMVGALLVRNTEGVQFKVGSGLKDSDRREPPPIGSTITYGYSGKTHTGKPRFPRYLRLRPPE